MSIYVFIIVRTYMLMVPERTVICCSQRLQQLSLVCTYIHICMLHTFLYEKSLPIMYVCVCMYIQVDSMIIQYSFANYTEVVIHFYYIIVRTSTLFSLDYHNYTYIHM